MSGALYPRPIRIPAETRHATERRESRRPTASQLYLVRWEDAHGDAHETHRLNTMLAEYPGQAIRYLSFRLALAYGAIMLARDALHEMEQSQ